jgi:transcriptional regulator with XRE-family HTH domain
MMRFSPELLVTIRKAAGLSQKAAAERAGMKPQNYGRVELGKVRPGCDVLCRIADGLGCDVHALLESDGKLIEVKR